MALVVCVSAAEGMSLFLCYSNCSDHGAETITLFSVCLYSDDSFHDAVACRTEMCCRLAEVVRVQWLIGLGVAALAFAVLRVQD